MHGKTRRTGRLGERLGEDHRKDYEKLKVHKIENFLTPILEFALFLC
jgi:hypothetical protein